MGGGRAASPAKTRQRSIRATILDASIAAATSDDADAREQDGQAAEASEITARRRRTPTNSRARSRRWRATSPDGSATGRTRGRVRPAPAKAKTPATGSPRRITGGHAVSARRRRDPRPGERRPRRGSGPRRAGHDQQQPCKQDRGSPSRVSWLLWRWGSAPRRRAAPWPASAHRCAVAPTTRTAPMPMMNNGPR
jgi:hypothetical protein